MKQRNFLIIILLSALIVVSFLLINNIFHEEVNNSTQEFVNYTYQIVNSYPHDPNAFTQGLVFKDGVIFEGTGLYGQSTIRRVNLETGNVTQLFKLDDNFFGEGITIFENKIIQLTWKSKIGFVYDVETFELLDEFEYNTEGWGITHNESSLIMSDGTSTLYFINPDTYQIVDNIKVYDKEPVTFLNELEYINGSIFANIWLEDEIVIINPKNGEVTGRIDLTDLRNSVDLNTADVLNGIAYDSDENRLFITGKRWSKLFQIELQPTK